MAKGRRYIPSRSERLLGVAPSYHYGHSHHDEAEEVAELEEGDVWSTVVYGGYAEEWVPRAATESGIRSRRDVTTQDDDDSHVQGGLSLAFQEKTTPSRRIVHQFGGTAGGSRAGRHVATSAPVNVPDWSKILRVNSVESIQDSDEDDRVGNSGMEPPHEYLARSQKTNARSVFEGVGRTLKGRDMSRVRDAVWSQTGFEG